MAEIVQLKNETGETIYPVTSGEAINMTGGKSLDKAFSEKTEQLEQDYLAKKTALEADYLAKNAALDSQVSTKFSELDESLAGYREVIFKDDSAITFDDSSGPELIIPGCALGRLSVVRIKGEMVYTGSSNILNRLITVKTPSNGTYIVLANVAIRFYSNSLTSYVDSGIPAGKYNSSSLFQSNDKLTFSNKSIGNKCSFDFTLAMVRIS